MVGGVLRSAGAALGGEVLHLVDDLGDRLRFEQVAQVGLTQELSEERGVQGQRRGTALGQRGVPLVEVLRDVAEQQ